MIKHKTVAFEIDFRTKKGIVACSWAKSNINLVFLHIMESNCPYNNFQQAKPPLICSQQDLDSGHPSPVLALCLCNLPIYVTLPELALSNKSNKKPVINQPSLICHFFDTPKFEADEIWLLLTMWGQWTPFFERMLQEFFPVPQKVSAIFCNTKYKWQRPLHLK